MTVADVIVDEPDGTFPRYSLTLSDEPAGSPKDKAWKGAVLRLNGLSSNDLIWSMRRIIARLEAGESLWTISRP